MSKIVKPSLETRTGDLPVYLPAQASMVRRAIPIKCFVSPDRPIFWRKRKKSPRFAVLEVSILFTQHIILSNRAKTFRLGSTLLLFSLEPRLPQLLFTLSIFFFFFFFLPNRTTHYHEGERERAMGNETFLWPEGSNKNACVKAYSQALVMTFLVQLALVSLFVS